MLFCGSYVEGQTDAMVNFERMNYYMSGYGLPAGTCGSEMNEYLWAHYRVQAINFGCLNFGEAGNFIYRRAYNNKMRALLNTGHRKDIFKEAHDAVCADKETGKPYDYELTGVP
jgi:hypothetical protein